MPDADSSPALDALRIECEQHQETLRRAARSNDRVGMLTPLVGIVLVLPLVTGMRVHEQRLAALVVVAMSLGGLLTHFTWIEFLELVRFKYAVLYPRLYRMAGNADASNYLEFTAPRSLRSWIPALFYNAIAFGTLVAIWSGLLLHPAMEHGTTETWVLCIGSALSLLATVKTAHVVLVASRTLEGGRPSGRSSRRGNDMGRQLSSTTISMPVSRTNGHGKPPIVCSWTSWPHWAWAAASVL